MKTESFNNLYRELFKKRFKYYSIQPINNNNMKKIKNIIMKNETENMIYIQTYIHTYIHTNINPYR